MSGLSGFRYILSVKDHIERALIGAYISILFTRGLIVVAEANVDVFVKAMVLLLVGFFVVIFWAATISTLRSIVTRKNLQSVVPLWMSKLRGVKRALWLAVLATSSGMATHILVHAINQLQDPFEIAMTAYLAVMLWIMFALETIYTLTSSQKLQQNQLAAQKV